MEHEKMLDPDRALKEIQGIVPQGQVELIPLVQALGRVLGRAVIAELDMPPFAKAAMDGYAVSKEDSSSSFRILETIPAGAVPGHPVKPGFCSRIMTGAMMPAGADQVIRVEYAEERDGQVRPLHPEPNNNVIEKGENCKRGDPLLEPKVLGSQDIGVLASLGLDRVPVVRPPRVGIIATGSELRDPGQALGPGEIYNSNGPQLCAQTAAMGCPYCYYGIVLDRIRELKAGISRALAECDVVLLSGGVSMGQFDLVPRVLEEEGVEIRFHKLAIKPGKPTLFGRRADTYVFGLPGNPVSVFVIFEVLVKVLLYRWMGLNYTPIIRRAPLATTIRRRDVERVEFNPVRWKGEAVEPITYHGSSHLNALSRADGLIRIERGCKLIKRGEEVDVRSI